MNKVIITISLLILLLSIFLISYKFVRNEKFIHAWNRKKKEHIQNLIEKAHTQYIINKFGYDDSMYHKYIESKRRRVPRLLQQNF